MWDIDRMPARAGMRMCQREWSLLSRWKHPAPTQRGVLNRLFQLNRRVFKAYLLAPAVFQKLAEMLLKRLDGILNYCRTRGALRDRRGH